MSYKTIFHGSDVIVEHPKYHFEGSNEHNDYGLGFYCTKNLDMAKEWANRTTRNGYVNKYSFDDRNLKILDLTDKTKYNVLNWIAILAHNRNFQENDRVEFAEEIAFLEKYYINTQEYDVVIGYRADDAYFTFPKMFIKNALTFEKLEEIYLLGNLGMQYVLISEKAFKRVKFVGALNAEPIFYERYHRRLDAANDTYKKLEVLEKNKKGHRIKDLMSEAND